MLSHSLADNQKAEIEQGSKGQPCQIQTRGAEKRQRSGRSQDLYDVKQDLRGTQAHIFGNIWSLASTATSPRDAA